MGDGFVYNEIYGPGVTDGTIMKSGDYILCRVAMRNLAEAINRIRILKFIAKHEEEYRLTTLVRDVSEELQSAPNEEILREKWNSVRKFINTNISEKFQSFLCEGEATSEIWRFWNVFLDFIVPVVVDLTRSFRESNWELHLSTIRKAMSLFFAFSRTNYCRWTPLYFEDCMNLETKHPYLYESFYRGDFVVHHSLRRGSGVPMDQALEKEYNKKAKGPGGIIGVLQNGT